MARAIRIGYQARPQHGSYDAMHASWIEAETLGVDAIYNWDHFYPLYDDPDGPHFECWTLIAALAEATSRVEVGALVTCMSYRNPNLLADMARTVDHISNGRLTLGIGSGWFEKDYTEFGYEFGTAITRLHAFRDAIPVIKDRMAIGNPPPVRGKIPIMIGGGGEKFTLRLVAEHANQYNYFGPPESYGNKIKILDEWCAKVGRNPREIERTVAIYPKEVTPEIFAQYKEVGAEHIILTCSDPFDFSDLEKLLSWSK